MATYEKAYFCYSICCMVLPMIPASAVEETTTPPTIEEILNSYHKKAFAAQTAEENGDASTYARGGSNQTLEQETVAELTAAGYEAYNVTGENYEELEETLNTDFAELGLDPECSYVVVISGSELGENASSTSNPNGRVYQPPLYEDFDGNASGSCYTYSYGGQSYTMRRILVTTDEDPNYATSDSVDLIDLMESNALVELFERFLNHVVTTKLDKETESSLGTILSLFGIDFVDIDTTQDCILNFYAGVSRVRSYTQIYESATQTWESWYSAEAATLVTRYSGMYYSRSLKRYTSINLPENVYPLNSDYYFDYAHQSEQAILNRAIPRFTFDNIGTIQILLINMNTGRNIEVLSFAQYVGTTP